MVERFTMTSHPVDGGAMDVHPHGDYVLYSDFAELAAENERLKQEVENWKTSAAGWQKIAKVDAEALSRTGAVKVKRSDILTKIALWADDEGMELSMGQGDDLAGRILSALEPATPETRACTCHPDDNPPDPCTQKFAYSDCVAAAPEDPAMAKPASIRAWRIKKGEPIPQWLEKTENAELTAGCDLIVIEAEDAGFDVYRSDPNSFANMMEGTLPDPNKHATVTGAPTNLHAPTALEAQISKLQAEIAELTRAAPEGQQPVAVEDAAKLVYAEMDYAAALPGEQGEGLLPWGQDQHLMSRALKVATALTRSPEQAVTEAMNLARAVLAQVMTAGFNTPGPTPEDVEKAFWALDDALKAAMEAGG